MSTQKLSENIASSVFESGKIIREDGVHYVQIRKRPILKRIRRIPALWRDLWKAFGPIPSRWEKVRACIRFTLIVLK